MAKRLNYPAVSGILPDQESNPCPLCCQADIQPLDYQGSPRLSIFFLFNLLFYWNITALQNFVVFCQTSTWISHRYTYFLNPLFIYKHCMFMWKIWRQTKRWKVTDFPAKQLSSPFSYRSRRARLWPGRGVWERPVCTHGTALNWPGETGCLSGPVLMEQALGTRSSDAPRYNLSGGRVGAAPPQLSQPLLRGRHVGKAAVSQQATPPHRKEGNSRGQPQSPAEEPLFTFILLPPVFSPMCTKWFPETLGQQFICCCRYLVNSLH